jgi:outer membrane receptor protein involved in Fe transport
MKTIILLTSFVLALSPCFSQVPPAKISGQVLSEENKPLESATVQLISDQPKKVTTTLSTSDGRFVFDSIIPGKYVIDVSGIGYTKYSSSKFAVTAGLDKRLPDVILIKTTHTLTGINVSSQRPFIEQKADRMIINVDASPSNAGATALEVLEKSPGVTIDNNGNISLKGKQGVTIMMDSKPTYLSAADLSNILKNMPASALDQIEIMTNPSAKYDAAGNSGIINIKTKKNKSAGSNGNFSVGNTSGLFKRNNKEEITWKPSFTFNYNYKKNKINFFTNFIYNHREGRSELSLLRHYYRDSKQIDSLNNVNTYFKFRNNNATLKLGVDYYADKKNVFGVVMNGFVFAGRPRPLTHTTFSDLDGTIFSRIDTRIINKLDWNNYGLNFNYKHSFDTSGREFTSDLDYAHYKNTSEQLLTTGFFDGNYQKTADSLFLKGHLPATIDIYSVKGDYVHPFKNNIRIEAGFKSSIVKSDNLVSYLRKTLYDWSPDNRNNHFLYNENINAAYVNVNKKIKKWNFQTGLRAENTNSKGYQVTGNSNLKKHYINLFPSVSAAYELNKKNQLTASFSRRVQRPNYQDLNPFTFFLDSLSYRQGNPNLGPQFSYNYELTHSWAGKLTTTLNYSSTRDVISGIVRQERGSHNEIITFLTIDNIAKLESKGVMVTAPVQLYKWWNISFSGNLYNNHYNGTFSTTENNQPKIYNIDLNYTSFTLNLSNTFVLKKGLTAEVSGWYNHKSLQQLMVAEPMGQLNLGLTKNNLLKGKGTLKLNARDPFNFQVFRAKVRYGNIDEKIYNRWDNRSYGVTFSYRFGKGQVNQTRKKSGLADEQNRLNVAQ